MKNYQHILFATDLTKSSELVADKALAMAQKTKAKLSIAHIFMPSYINYLGGEFALPIENNLDETLQQKSKQALANQAKRLGIAPADQWLEVGSPQTIIIELAQKLKVDLIVVGNHELQGLSLILGSVTDTIFHKMNCDVLAVRVPDTDS